ncbi:uncharacterized protein [Amphiura filiformis]|uniref:uncharacterized protein n=1 Tax=Amphiura filiformis TaxID=82378 RepID=UPI003B210BED
MTFIWLRIAMLLLATYGAFGKHFRGGSMSWKPVGNNQIELKYQVSFTATIDSKEGDECTEVGSELEANADIECPLCQEDERVRTMMWICNDLDLDEDSAYGQYTMRYNIPADEFEIKYDNCCWIPLESPLTGGAKGWKMLTRIDVTPRPDGRINRSPVSASLPTEKFYRGCQYELRIPASDPDNDAVRCRYAQGAGECSTEFPGACGAATAGLTINAKGCILHFDTSHPDVTPGKHAVNVIIEDFLKPFNKKTSQALSKVSLLFLLDVDEESDTCAKPDIIDPPLCKTVRPGNTLELVIVAEPGDATKPIKTITTQTPSGMTESGMTDDPTDPNRKTVTLTWTPTVADIGEHPVCYSALDYGSYTSGQSCTFIYVDDDPLHPLPETSTPAPGTVIVKDDVWTIRFSDQIQQPNKKQSSAFIRIVEVVTNTVIYEVAASDASVYFSVDRN